VRAHELAGASCFLDQSIQVRYRIQRSGPDSGGYRTYGQLPPILAATLGALVTTWATFVPCFLWIFLGGPYIEKLRGNEGLTTTLSAVTAAVVGVVLNLAVWFGLHVIFPSANVVDWFAVVLGLAAFVAMIKWKVDIIPVVLGAGLLGLIFKTLF
jgi:chromate transporter